MKSKYLRFVSLTIFLFLLFTTIFFTATQNEIVFSQTAPEEGKKAPNFTLQDLSGEDVSLEDFQGQKVFLNFWATWCPPCKAEMPDIQKLHKNNEEVKILAVNVQENKDKVFNYLMENNFSFTTLLDINGQVASQYLVRGIPSTFVIDEEGTIIKKHVGVLTYKQMQDIINE